MTTKNLNYDQRKHIRQQITTALTKLYNTELLQINLSNSRIICPIRFYLIFIIRESIEIFTCCENSCDDYVFMVFSKISKKCSTEKMKQ